jgi:predicted RNase H-like HicB family nuclease
MSQSNDEEFAESTLSEAVENQIREGKPLAAALTLQRLLAEGQSRADAIRMMAQVLAVEVRAIVEQERPFDMQWYVAALQALPDLPAVPGNE